MSFERAVRRISRSKVRRWAGKAFGLLRAGEWRPVLNALRTLLYSDSYAYGLCRDLTVRVDVPAPAILLTIRPIERSDVQAFTEIDHHATRPALPYAHSRLLASDIQTCYVAVTEEGAPCNMQYLILPSENDKVQRVLQGLFPRLAEDEALLEGAFTPRGMPRTRNHAVRYGGLGTEGKEGGGTAAPDVRHPPERSRAQGCRRAGFVPNMLVTRRFRLFKRRFTFTPLLAGTPVPGVP